MKQRLYVSGYKRWSGEIDLRFETTECEDPSSWNVPLGAIEIELPDDIVPNEICWNALTEKHKIRCAKYKITEAQVRLSKAEEELRDLLAIPDLT